MVSPVLRDVLGLDYLSTESAGVELWTWLCIPLWNNETKVYPYSDADLEWIYFFVCWLRMEQAHYQVWCQWFQCLWDYEHSQIITKSFIHCLGRVHVSYGLQINFQERWYISHPLEQYSARFQISDFAALLHDTNQCFLCMLLSI